MKKIKFIILVLVIILISTFGILYLFNNNKLSKLEFTSYDLTSKYAYNNSNIDIEDITDLKLYQFTTTIANEEKYYRIAITDDSNLYLYDLLTTETNQLSNNKFTALFAPDTYVKDKVICYALSDKKLYKITLTTNNINDAVFEEVNTNYTIEHFVNIKSNPNSAIDNLGVYVITSDGEVVDAVTGVSFADKTVNLQNEYSITNDYKIINSNGYYLTDNEGNPYFYKYSFHSNYDNFEGKPSIIILTTNNKLIYSYKNKLYVSELTVDMFKDEEIDESYILKRVYFTNLKYYDMTGNIYKIELK